MSWVTSLGDCVSILKDMESESIHAVVCDPPYGMEFMGGSWEQGGGFSKPGIGNRAITWPSFSANSKYGNANPTCAVCGGRLRGSNPCICEKPHDHWKPIGKRRKPEVANVSMLTWHQTWLQECYRVLIHGGEVKAFSGARTFHHVVRAMVDVGFENVRLEGWVYLTGFPKSHNLKDTWEGWGTSLKPAWEPVVIGRKPQ